MLFLTKANKDSHPTEVEVPRYFSFFLSHKDRSPRKSQFTHLTRSWVSFQEEENRNGRGGLFLQGQAQMFHPTASVLYCDCKSARGWQG